MKKVSRETILNIEKIGMLIAIGHKKNKLERKMNN